MFTANRYRRAIARNLRDAARARREAAALPIGSPMRRRLMEHCCFLLVEARDLRAAA